MNAQVESVKTHQDGVSLLILEHMFGPLLLPDFHVFWKKKSPSNRIGHLPSPDIFALQERIIFIYKSVINKESTTPRLFQVVLVLVLVRNMTRGLLKSSVVFAVSFLWGLSFGSLEWGQWLLIYGFTSLFFSPFPFPHNILPLREPRRRGKMRSFRWLWGKRPEHRSYVDGLSLNRYFFSQTRIGIEKRGEPNNRKSDL